MSGEGRQYFCGSDQRLGPGSASSLPPRVRSLGWRNWAIRTSRGADCAILIRKFRIVAWGQAERKKPDGGLEYVGS